MLNASLIIAHLIRLTSYRFYSPPHKGEKSQRGKSARILRSKSTGTRCRRSSCSLKKTSKNLGKAHATYPLICNRGRGEGESTYLLRRCRNSGAMLLNGVTGERFPCVVPKGQGVERGNVTAMHSAIFRDRNHGCARG